MSVINIARLLHHLPPLLVLFSVLPLLFPLMLIFECALLIVLIVALRLETRMSYKSLNLGTGRKHAKGTTHL